MNYLYVFVAVCLCSGTLFSSEAHAGTLPASTSPNIHSAVVVEKHVREFFKDAPVMIEIARCESKFRQYTDAGNVLRGGSSGGMVGVFQFFESIHVAAALKLGFDITTLEGNLGYARHVYTTQGTTPWNSAKSCWNIPPKQHTTTISAADRTKLLAHIETLTKLIAVLQKQLQLKQAQNKTTAS
jgi:hypothetical protein